MPYGRWDTEYLVALLWLWVNFCKIPSISAILNKMKRMQKETETNQIQLQGLKQTEELCTVYPNWIEYARSFGNMLRLYFEM